MKHFAVCLLVALCILTTENVNSAISFGSRQAAIETTGGTFDFTNTAALSKGVLRTLGSGSITGDASEYLDCTKMKVQTKYDVATKGMHVDGKLYLNDDTLTLDNNDQLIVNGGQVSQEITVTADSGTPAILQGSGFFANDITIGDEAWLHMRWQGPLNANISLNGDSTVGTGVSLEDDLWFASGYGPQATNDVTGNTIGFDSGRYYMYLGNVTIGSNRQTWSMGRLSLFGDLTLTGKIYFSSSAAKISGNGHKIIISGDGGFGSSIDATFTDVVMTGITADSFPDAGAEYTFNNSILADGTNEIRIVDGTISSGSPFSNDVAWTNGGTVELLKDLNQSNRWIFDAAASINGNGNAVSFTDTTGYFDYNATLTLTDIALTNVSAESFNNLSSQTLKLSNVDWYDGAQAGAININASPLVDGAQYAELTLTANATAGNIFGIYTIWPEGAAIDLMTDTTLSTTWTLSKATVIDGRNNTFNLLGGTIDYNADLYLSNMVLGDVDAGSFSNAADMDLYLSNVTWVDDTTEGIVRITGNTEDTITAAAQIELTTSASSNLFSTAVNWKNGVNIELLKGITFNTGAAWTFTKNSVINGNGNILDLNSVSGTNPITVASGQTLKITDAVIKGWGSSNIVFAGATLELANVTIVLDDDVTLGATEDVVINGGVRFVTGSNKFDGSLADSDNYINGITVWYDTLGTLDQSNLKMGSFSGGGRIAMFPLSEWADITFDSGSSHIQQTMHLLYDIDVGPDAVYEALGRQITFDNTAAFTLKGNGRTLYMGKMPTSGDTNKVGNQLITVSGSASNIIEVHDLIFDGWEQEHITDSNDLIRYGTGTVVKLQKDEVISKTIQFAHNNSGESIVLDLNGNVLDLASDTASLTITDTDATVTIKNGRILNVGDQTGGDPKLHALGTTATLVFQDIDLVLSGDTTLTASNVQFKGDCTVTGTGNYELKCYHTPITIADGARVSFGPGMTFGLYGNGSSTDASVSFGSNNSTLSFSRSTFDVSNLVSAPAFTHGTLRIDDVTTFTGDMTLGSSTAVLDLDVDLMPAASIEVSSGTITYANAS